MRAASGVASFGLDGVAVIKTEAAPRIMIIGSDAAAPVLGGYLRILGFRVEAVAAAHGLPTSGDPGLVLAALDALDEKTLSRIGSCAGSPGLIALYRRRDVDIALRALEVGADDIFPMDGAPRELLARIRAVLRRCARTRRGGLNATDAWRYGRYAADGVNATVRLPNGETVKLTQREFELFRALAERRGEILGRDELLDLVMGSEADVFDRAVDCLVSRLRKKLTVGLGHDPITTYVGVGYAFDDPAWS